MSAIAVPFLTNVSRHFTLDQYQKHARFYVDAQGKAIDSLDKSPNAMPTSVNVIDKVFSSIVSAPLFTAQDQAELEGFRAFKCELMTNPSLQSGADSLTPGIRADLMYVAEKSIDALESKCSRSRSIVVVSAMASISGVAALVGGALAVEWLITASIISAVALAIICVSMGAWNRVVKNELPADVLPKANELLHYYQALPVPAHQVNNQEL